VNLSALLRSWTSVYQLLPTYPVVLARGEYRRVAETDLPYVERRRAAEAFDEFHEAIRQAVENRLETVSPSQTYALLPVVGIDQETLQSAELREGQIVLSQELPAWVIDRISNRGLREGSCDKPS
jgi:hypothetical protein